MTGGRAGTASNVGIRSRSRVTRAVQALQFCLLICFLEFCLLVCLIKLCLFVYFIDLCLFHSPPCIDCTLE